jgi:outer membrane biosynthesis protein TonB
MEKNGTFVFQNSKGEVFRTWKWSEPTFAVASVNDTGRVVILSESEWSDEDTKKEHELLKLVESASVQKKALSLRPDLIVAYRDDESISGAMVPAETFSEADSLEPLKQSFKYSSATMTAGLLILLLMAWMTPKPVMIETHEVQIIEKPKTEKAPVVEMAEHLQKEVPKINKLAQHKQKKIKMAQVRPRNNNVTGKSINQMGALGVLGSLSNSKQTGGIEMKNIQTSAGPGLGGAEGSGGAQLSTIAKGMVSSAYGYGNKVNGAGGYGTRGAGGGRGGYGTISMVGSAGGDFQPIDQDTFVEGGLDRAQITAVIERHQGEIRYCYEQGLQHAPHLNGRVAMRFMIGSDGRVNVANIQQSSLKSAEVESCITGHLRGWQFPKPRGGVTVKVTYPFMLRRVSDS